MSSPFKFCRHRLGVVPTINRTNIHQQLPLDIEPSSSRLSHLLFAVF
uniref:Uncharacterized protein n=1 Tax=Moniliophthora roreri TaxID=221103 RepID=A0A0W0G0F6_MONRR